MSNGSKQVHTSMAEITKNVDYYLSIFDISIFVLEDSSAQDPNQRVVFFDWGSQVFSLTRSTCASAQESLLLAAESLTFKGAADREFLDATTLFLRASLCLKNNWKLC